MVKVKSPLMSLDASGTLAEAIVFSKWKGRAYVRSHAIPANPRTPAQIAVRTFLTAIARQWSLIPSTPQATWQDLAQAQSVAPFNAYTAHNLDRLNRGTYWTRAYPATGDGDPTAVTAFTVALEGQIAVATIDHEGPADDGGCFVGVHASQTTGFTPGPTNVIATSPVTNDQPQTIPLRALTPGTWFLRAVSYPSDVASVPFATERTITIS